MEGWEPVRAAALDPDTPFDRASIPADFGDIVPDTGALLTQGQVIGLMQEHARAGDTIVAAAGGPPGDLQKVWDATEGRFCHLEFGFSCMGYEIPAGMGVRLADPNPDSRVVVFIGDGTFLHVAHRAGHRRAGEHRRHRGDPGEPRLPGDPPPADGPPRPRVRQRVPLPHRPARPDGRQTAAQPRLDGDYLEVDLVQVAQGLGARGIRANTAAEVRAALDETRGHQGPVVIVVPVIPHVDLPGAGAWWDVAPSEVSEDETVQRLRTEYEAGLSKQLWLG